MRRRLNTLYVTTEGAWLRKDGANVVMDVEGAERGRVPAHMLESIVCIGRVLLSPPLLGYCAEQGICVSYLSQNGRFLARVEGPVSGNVLLRREQYRRSDNRQRCVAIARNMLLGKVHNQRAVVSRALRDHGSTLPSSAESVMAHARTRLRRILDKLLGESDLDTLRGLEGEAAQAYFGVFDHMIRVDNPSLRFRSRSRRPPRDCVNALLSFVYTLLTHDCRSALETVGLDPSVGFLHTDRPGRPSLALDLAEEFRPFFADRLVLSLLNLRQVSDGDFAQFDSGAVQLAEGARKIVLTAYQSRKKDELMHSFLEEKVSVGLLPSVQAQLLARHLRGDLVAYPPFVWK